MENDGRRSHAQLVGRSNCIANMVNFVEERPDEFEQLHARRQECERTAIE